MGASRAVKRGEASVILNPLSEVRYRYRLAVDHLTRAERLFALRDWAGAVSACQLSVENFAKSVMAVFEVPAWGHDPSERLRVLIGKFPSDVEKIAKELASLVREMAPEHGRSSYGEPSAGLTPSDIYKEAHAINALKDARRAKKITERILNRLGVRTQKF